MGLVEDEVQRLRDIVNGFESRIQKLESRALGAPASTADEVRMILIGPPGAGQWDPTHICALWPQGRHTDTLQARARRPPRSRRSLAAAIWYVVAVRLAKSWDSPS